MAPEVGSLQNGYECLSPTPYPYTQAYARCKRPRAKVHAAKKPDRKKAICFLDFAQLLPDCFVERGGGFAHGQSGC